MADLKERIAGAMLAGAMATGAAGPSQAGNFDARIAKVAQVPAGGASSPAERNAVIQALSQQAARDTQFDKKLSALERYNFSIDVNDKATPGKPGMESDLGGWSGVRNPNNFTLGVHPQDLKNMGQVLNSALAQMAETEEADNNRLFREIKSPRGAGTTHQERLNNYIASRERLEALQGAAGIAVSRDPQRLAEENAGRKRYGMPELPVSQELPEGASSRDTRRAPSSVPYGNAGIPDYRRLSDVDCRGAMNNAVRGGTTVMVGNRLDVSPADIHKTVKDFMNSQTERPDISNWNVSSLRQLSRDVGQEYRNQMMTAKLAVDGIAAGGDPRTLTENITNPRVRELIVNQARPGMTDQDLTKIRDGVTGEMGFADKNMAIVREMAAASQDERMQRRAVAAECAPGS